MRPKKEPVEGYVIRYKNQGVRLYIANFEHCGLIYTSVHRKDDAMFFNSIKDAKRKLYNIAQTYTFRSILKNIKDIEIILVESYNYEQYRHF